MGACVSELQFVSVYAWCLCGVGHCLSNHFVFLYVGIRVRSDWYSLLINNITNTRIYARTSVCFLYVGIIASFVWYSLLISNITSARIYVRTSVCFQLIWTVASQSSVIGLCCPYRLQLSKGRDRHRDIDSGHGQWRRQMEAEANATTEAGTKA